MDPDELIAVDHDQRFKELIRAFFGDFMRLFFAKWATRFDPNHVEWLNQELLPLPPEGDRHRLDLVAKLRTKEPVEPSAKGDPNTWLAIVHIEVEAPDRTTSIKARLPDYFIHLTAAHRLPVLPIVLYLTVGLNGIGEDAAITKFWEFEVLRLNYLYVGLPALDAETYIHGDNILGVALAGLMKLPAARASELGLEALRRICGADNTEQEIYLLNDCFQAYARLSDTELERIYGIVNKEPTRRKAMMPPRNKTMYDRGLELAREEALVEGRRLAQLELLEAMLENRFGPLLSATLDRLRDLPDGSLKALALQIHNVKSLAELGL